MTQCSDQAGATQSGAVRAAAGRLRTFYDRYTPWISLGLGVLACMFSHKGVDFAPKAVALVALAWLLPVVVTRWLRPPAEPGGEPAGSAGSVPSREGMGTLSGFPYQSSRC